MIITKRFKFDSAHKLPNYKGDCANLHGHSYKLFVSVKGDVDSNGFVIDFKYLKQIVKENNELRSVHNPDWSNSFVNMTDEISSLEASAMDSKVVKGFSECGKKLTWYDFGYDAQYLVEL